MTQIDNRLFESARGSSKASNAMGSRLMLTDLAIISAVVLLSEVIRFGSASLVSVDDRAGIFHLFELVLIVLVWFGSLWVFGAYDPRMLGHGPEEYRSAVKATFVLFAFIAIVSYSLKLEVARGYVLIAMPAGIIGLLVGRYLWRQWLVRRRSQGLCSSQTVIVGTSERIEVLIQSLRSNPSAGYRVVGVCPTDSFGTESIAGVPVLGNASQAVRLARREGVDVVLVASVPNNDGGLRNLAWQLEGTEMDLIVVPGLVDVAGPRVRTRPLGGHALLLVEQPVFSGMKLVLKTAFDRIGAAAVIVAISPLLLLIAFMVKRQDGGPVFFRQKRVGLNGEHFAMTKFRSMVVNAEQQRSDVEGLDSAESVNQNSGPLFKVRNDPRITPIGHFLRKYSLDELPQLFDVLRGDMSLVGPRPPLPSEVAQYDDDARRRLLVKPGMTGLWQINGRSDLSWEEAVRFDLYYVENWSIMSDLVILARTGRAVLAGRGAY